MARKQWRVLLPALCSLGLLMTIVSPRVLTAGSAGADKLEILKAEALTTTSIRVTFNDRLASFQPGDLELDAALGDWYSLNPMLTKKFTVKKVTEGVNAEGLTTVLLETEEAIHPDATITRTVAENPKSIPFQDGNYYTGDQATDRQRADNLLTWQTTEGGWYKYSVKDKYGREWDGKENKSGWRTAEGKDIGTIDNNATTNEILFLALMYKETGEARYKAAVERGLQFLLTMQYPNGGWPQVYPARGNYSDYVTFNDNAMMRVMNVLRMARDKQYPFNTDMVTEDLAGRIQNSLDLGLDYILKSQIVSDGELAGWCAQHDPVTYEPKEARSYEHPSIAGAESVDIIKYLMALPEQTPEVKRAVEGALSWFDAHKLSGMTYISGDKNNVYFVPDPASTIWYRFYEIGTNLPIFSGRDGIIKHNILEIEAERRNGYRWAGSWALNLLKIAKTTGYYENRVYVKVVGSDSQSQNGKTLTKGDVKRVEDAIAPQVTLQPIGRQTGNHYNIDVTPWSLSGAVSEKAQVKVNGVPTKLDSSLSFTSDPITLQPGMNVITITAVDSAGNQAAPITVQAVPTNGTIANRLSE
ncbi:pectate lyase [Paenibacillus sp. CC-CFT747]|nr:pectate lyase [Paenibacillus sp. CC-CFT747]